MLYDCVDCNRSFVADHGVLDHCKAKGHECYKCGLCHDGDKVFKNESELEKHRKNHHAKCEECKTVFVNSNALREHYRNSSRCDNSCQQCNRYFQDKSARKQHYQGSPAHRDTYCRQCEQNFQDKSAREQHYQNAAVHRDRYCTKCIRLFDDGDGKKKHDKMYCHECLQSEEEEEVARRVAIEESRRKLAELEADKPLWEAAAKQRSMREEAESGIRVRVTTRHSVEKERAEAERKARTFREAEERRAEEEQRQREAEEKRKEEEQRQREAAARRVRESRQRQQQRWACGLWTTQRALECYKVLSEEFDSTKFSDELPLTVEAVPWPTLTPPAQLDIADVNWGAVEKFFTLVEHHMGSQEYKAFVEKSHRRFHPDRWQSRNLWKTVVDETERDGMKVAANAVAQALTPIWRAATGR